MHMTNQQFIQTYLVPLGYEQSLVLLMTSRELLQRYGTQASVLLKQLPEQEDVAIFFDILRKYDKLNRATLGTLVPLLGTFFLDTKKVYTFSSSHIDDDVLKKLQIAFPDVTIETQQSLQIGVELRGSGNIYRRSLETDLQKLRNSK